MTIILYDYWRSSAAYRLRIAFNLAGLPYETVPVDLLAGEQRSPEHLGRNPQGLVPVAEIDGTLFTQSLAIIEFLDDSGYFPFLPGDIIGRARIRAMSYAIAMEIHPVCNLSVAKYAGDASGGQIGMKDWMTRFIPPGLAAFEAMVARSPERSHCFGDRITMADVCLVPQLYNARRWGIDLGPYPVISEVSVRLEAKPNFREAHPDVVRARHDAERTET
ncbi:MAG: maleylacetoacetate isomerase [Paracoccaceae bacterium]|nr:maleylacetoacetate isomerase [Paracoccaceae bacterium]